MYVQNKWPNSALGFKTPEEIYTDIKPLAAHLIYFGLEALAYILSDKRTKLDAVSFKWVFTGYDDCPKAYRMIDLISHNTIICGDAIFDDSNGLREAKMFDIPPAMANPNPPLNKEPVDKE